MFSFSNFLKVEVFASQNKVELSQLVPNLKDVDPDEAFSSIPYEKGHMLLFYLEQKLGGVGMYKALESKR